ncbi:MAG: GNAT family N-acetyltransferase, partial [Firmicutes bacterium]|nr:GNAT family N-acetyltransferase [Bacillota bacterium]
MIIRHSEERDFERMLEIYAYARQFMADHGNPLQWGPTGWPPVDLLRCDIASGKSYVCEHDGCVIATFYFEQGKDIDPTYLKIEDGQWA